MKLISNINKFLKFPILEQILIAKVFLMAGFFRITILTIPFKKITASLSKELAIKKPSLSETQIIRFGKLIDMVCRNTPWESKCLVQALICKKLCRKYGILNTLYIGVQKDINGKIASHAWVSDNNNNIIVGGYYTKQFKIIIEYTDRSK